MFIPAACWHEADNSRVPNSVRVTELSTCRVAQGEIGDVDLQQTYKYQLDPELHLEMGLESIMPICQLNFSPGSIS